MPSPFPGMDPYIEMGYWQTFHNLFIAAMTGVLVPEVRPGYSVEVGQDIYLVTDEGETLTREPDVAVLNDADDRHLTGRGGGDTAAAGVLTPVMATIPIPRERRHRFIEVRDIKSREVVTVIELLSPINRIDRGGRRKHIDKRRELLEADVNLVEVDLMRRGHSLPVKPRMPRCDYSVVVCRAASMPRAEVYAWTLRDPLPNVPVPLAGRDPDAVLKLQPAFNEAYDRIGFDYTLPYDEELHRPVGESDRGWLAETLSSLTRKKGAK